MTSEDSTEYKVASAPFDTDFADFILRTPDKVDFWVHSQILRITSTVFDAIVSIPHPTVPDSPQSSSRPVIDMTEDSVTLDCVLRCAYPTEEPKSTDLELLDRVLTAAHKYEFKRATAWVKRVLAQLIGTETLSVYTLACVHDLEDLAQNAATVLKQSKASGTINRRGSKKHLLAPVTPLSWRGACAQVHTSQSQSHIPEALRPAFATRG